MSTILKALRRLEEDKPASRAADSDRRDPNADESLPATDPRAADALRDRILAEEYVAEATREADSVPFDKRKMLVAGLAGAFAFVLGLGLYALIGDSWFDSSQTPAVEERTVAEAPPPSPTPSPTSPRPTVAAAAVPPTPIVSPSIAAGGAVEDVAAVAVAEPSEQTELARNAEQVRRAELATQAEQARQAEFARQAEQDREVALAEQAQRAEQVEQARRAEQEANAERIEQARLAKRATEAEAETAVGAEQDADDANEMALAAVVPTRAASANGARRTSEGPRARETVRAAEVPSAVSANAPAGSVRETQAADRTTVEPEPAPSSAESARAGDERPSSSPPPPTPVVAERLELPDLAVVRTSWHPKPDRRSAKIRLEETGDVVTLREGDAVGGMVIQEISPSAVVFKAGEVEVRRRIGQGSSRN